ncbi:nuclear transport factor 2 family protein [Streptomyces sp. NPDC055105]|uniref:nuclear transport factor 2 family protein n=1 Tax=Streptomyces sp. NPDC055105 TaxID=3365719 RepID=UPI0037CF0E53
MPNTTNIAMAAKTEIDAITAEFFGAFDNRGGSEADVDRIRRLTIPGAVIVSTGPAATAYTVDEFIEPRRKLLSDGRLVEFSEWETSEHTQIAGDIAARFGEYRKSGVMNGEEFEGGGTKSIQFVRTPEGWRIASFTWYDQP